MKAVILWELARRRNYLLWWSIAAAGLLLMLLLIYPSIHAQASKLDSVINQLPAALRTLKTGSSSSVDVSSPIGYLNSQVYYATMPLLQIIMAVGLGSSLLMRDEQNHTLELLLARPISRGKLLAAKALAGIICMVTVAALATIVTLIVAPLVKLNVGVAHLLAMNVYGLLFALSFGAIAFALTAVSNHTRRVATPLAVVASMGGYLLATMGSLTHYLQTPAKFLPYHYFTPQRILEGQAVTGLTIYLIGIFVVCTLVAWLGFRSRDIY